MLKKHSQNKEKCDNLNHSLVSISMHHIFALIAIWLDSDLKCLTITNIREAKFIQNCFWKENIFINVKLLEMYLNQATK